MALSEELKDMYLKHLQESIEEAHKKWGHLPRDPLIPIKPKSMSEQEVSDRQKAVEIVDNALHNAACIISPEQWKELMNALKVVMPESCFLKDRK